MDDEIYTDLVLQLLTAFSNSDTESPHSIIKMINDNDEFYGEGFFPGVVYASLIHMSLMIACIGQALNVDRQSALRHYALTYGMNREQFKEIPGLNPKFVTAIMKRILELKPDEF